jgi:hypothetical protein
MRVIKTLVLMIIGGLLSCVLIAAERPAYAQDAADQGAWSAPDGATSDTKKTAPRPMDISGCWSGTVTDTADGSGTPTFEFRQSGNLKKLALGSTFNLEWSDSAMAKGPLKGSVTSTGFTFKGDAGANCKVSGSAVGDDTALTGSIVFTGNCADLFQDVAFTITPGC